MDHNLHTPLDTAELTETDLLDAAIYGPDDYEIGTVAHVHGNGPATRVIVDVGGFMGIGSRQVALSTDQLEFMRDEEGIVHATTHWTKAEIDEMPEHQD